MDYLDERSSFIRLNPSYDIKSKIEDSPCTLSEDRQQLILSSFFYDSINVKSRVPISQSLMMQYYLVPDVAHSIIRNKATRGYTESFMNLDAMINKQSVITKPYFDIKDTKDGINLKVLKTSFITDAQNTTIDQSLSGIITSFINDVSYKKCKYLEDFIKVASNINDTFTDICMIYGEVEDTSYNVGDKHPILMMYILAGDNYLIRYNSVAEKRPELKIKKSSSIVHRSKIGFIKRQRIALSTLWKKTPDQLREISMSDEINESLMNNAHSNFQGDYLDINTFKKLSKVI